MTHPARKALKGKLVTSTQYTNWITPDKTRKTRKASMDFRRAVVVSRYAAQRVCSTANDAGAEAVFVVEGGGVGAGGETALLDDVVEEVFLAVLGPAI
jgi:hypothetical protein